MVSVPSSLEFDEGTSTGTTLATYTYTAPDLKGIDLGLSGTDSEDFTLSSSGILAFNEAPNFEERADSNRDNRYQVTMEAREQGDGTSVGHLNVTIRVTNVDEPGMVLTNVEEPRVGQTVRLNWRTRTVGKTSGNGSGKGVNPTAPAARLTAQQSPPGRPLAGPRTAATPRRWRIRAIASGSRRSTATGQGQVGLSSSLHPIL